MKHHKKILITQSNYIPWKGYFDAISLVDTVILYDEMQYTKQDWRNRNKIKTVNGLQWLTIPVKGNQLNQKINETKVANQNWRRKHWQSIKQNYSKATYFHSYATEFEALYEDDSVWLLSEINCEFIKKINKILGIHTSIRRSREFELKGSRSEKLLNLCIDLGATDYYSGPRAKDYLEVSLFEKENINVHWLDYSNYAEYRQLYGQFEHRVTILDLIFNEGPHAKNFMKYLR